MYAPRKLLFHFGALLIGSAIGLLLAFNISRTDSEIVYGFPLPWAAWQKVNDGWLDFVSPLSPLLFIADVILGIGCVYLILLVVRFALRARSGFED